MLPFLESGDISNVLVAPVTSVFGRTGAVVAQSGDYTYAQISGTPQLAQTIAAVSSKWLNSYSAVTGLFTATQPAFTDISGVAAAAQYVTFIGDSGSGGVKGAVLAPAAGDAAAGKFLKADGTWTTPPSSGGTVTTFSAGTFSPLFTTSVANPTTTPALSFAAITQNPNIVFAGPTSGGASAPTFRALVSADLPAGTGTVTSFSAGNLSPLFTTSVATATTTPALTFSLSNAGGGTLFGNNGTSAAAPAFTTAPVLGIPGTSTGTIALASSTASGKFTITAPASAATPTLTLPTTSNVLAGQFAGDGTVLSSTLAVASAAGTVTAALANAGGGTVLGNNTTSSAAPSYTIAPVLGIPGTSTGSIALASSTASGKFILTAPASASTPTLTLPTTSNVLAGQLAGDGTIFSASLVTASAAGTLTLPTPSNQTANTVFAGPTSGGAAAPTFRAIVAADIPAGTVVWNNIGNATGALTLANAGNATTFNQTSSVNWTWANTTAATSVGATSSSPIYNLNGTMFKAGVSASDGWTIQNIIRTANTSATVTNISETAGSVVTLTITGGNFVAGNQVTFTGLTTGTWLNNQTANLTTAGAGSITFTDPTSHGSQGSHAETGQVTQSAPNTLIALGHAAPGGNVSTTGAQLVALQLPATGGGVMPNIISTNNDTTGISVCPSSALPLFIINGSSGSTEMLRYYTAGTLRIQLTHNTTSNFFSVGGASSQAGTNVGLMGKGGTIAVPAAHLGANGAFTGTSGTQIGASFGTITSSEGGGNIENLLTFAPTSGTAAWVAGRVYSTVNQTGGANGNYTGFLINIVETALGGSANRLLSLQAGASGGTTELDISNTGIITTYNAVATVSQGVPSELATIDLTGQSAAKASTSLYAVPAGKGGMYRVTWTATITTAATTSSTLGGTNSFQINYTGFDDSVTKTSVSGNSITSAANTTGTAISGVLVGYVKASTTINYSFDYTSVGGTAMQYNLHVKVEAM